GFIGLEVIGPESFITGGVDVEPVNRVVVGHRRRQLQRLLHVEVIVAQIVTAAASLVAYTIVIVGITQAIGSFINPNYPSCVHIRRSGGDDFGDIAKPIKGVLLAPATALAVDVPTVMVVEIIVLADADDVAGPVILVLTAIVIGRSPTGRFHV